MNNPFEKISPMSDTLLQDALDSSNRSKSEQHEQIAAAKAAAPNKEVFDIAKLGEFYSTRGDNGEVLATPEVVEEYEAEYYLKYPEIKSLQEYAVRRKELDSQAAG